MLGILFPSFSDEVGIVGIGLPAEPLIFFALRLAEAFVAFAQRSSIVSKRAWHQGGLCRVSLTRDGGKVGIALLLHELLVAHLLFYIRHIACRDGIDAVVIASCQGIHSAASGLFQYDASSVCFIEQFHLSAVGDVNLRLRRKSGIHDHGAALALTELLNLAYDMIRHHLLCFSLQKAESAKHAEHQAAQEQTFQNLFHRK